MNLRLTLLCAALAACSLTAVWVLAAHVSTRPEPLDPPVCLYQFWVAGDARAYCATEMTRPPVPSHVCFIEGTSGDEVCLPLERTLSRRSV